MSDLAATRPHISAATDRTSLLWHGGTVFDVVLDGSHTGGVLALLDQSGAAGDATPMHVHRTDAEVFYVLEGSALAWVGDERFELATGTAAYLPPGQPHALRVVEDGTRILTVTTPAGFADFVREAGVPVQGQRPSSWEFDLGRIMAAAPKHGIDVVGPPPGD